MEKKGRKAGRGDEKDQHVVKIAVESMEITVKRLV